MSDKSLSLKDNGICQCCGATGIKSGAKIEGKEGLRGSNRLPIDSKISVELDNYVCVTCGYTESYINNRSILNRIEKQWQKVTIIEDES
ncbi:MAG: hypothetical protein Phog2KO_26790 [Phototrophicaceae bacterium]